MSGRINTSAFSDRKSTPHDDVKVGDVSWLWPGRIPFGQITLFAGKTDVGKTLVVDDVVARVTVGAEWPDGAGRAPVGEALIFCEDPIAAIQNPRLLAAGGDLAKVRHWRAPEFYIDHHLGELKADLAAHPETRLSCSTRSPTTSSRAPTRGCGRS